MLGTRFRVRVGDHVGEKGRQEDFLRRWTLTAFGTDRQTPMLASNERISF